MLVSVNFVLDNPLLGLITPVRQASATAATDTDNKVIWLAQCSA